MKHFVVLNLLFRPRSYSAQDVATMHRWIQLFQSAGAHVVATPPKERADVFDRLRVTVPDLFTAYPVVSFDTCDRWRAGFRKALELSGSEPATFFLWSADFRLDQDSERAALQLLDWSKNDDLVVGTIKAVGLKEEIDTAATIPLLEVWFPDESKEMLKLGLTKPRSELLRLSRPFLESALDNRWFPTEQTIYLILQCLWDERPMACLPFTTMEDDKEAKISPNVVEQVERMELWLKYMWRGHAKEWDKEEYLAKSEVSASVASQAYRQFLSRVEPTS